ncbi:MAG: sigma-70 family RNA polymerase sigma factor [Acidobacteriota bacterium]|nr:sigma-70 family RNA polymerase sigma factor [Acidobacteriota bacterium]
MNKENANDAENIVARIMNGDISAESDLVSAYGRAVSFILRKETRDEDAADDLYQETFRIGIEKIRKGDLREPRKLGSFLSSIARFAVIDYYRAEARNESRYEKTEENSFPAAPESQLRSLLRNEQAELVRQAIDEMKSDRDRQILFRFYIAEDEKDDICADLDLSSLHFNRVLHRAKQRYKELYLKMASRAGEIG